MKGVVCPHNAGRAHDGTENLEVASEPARLLTKRRREGGEPVGFATGPLLSKPIADLGVQVAIDNRSIYVVGTHPLRNRFIHKGVSYGANEGCSKRWRHL